MNDILVLASAIGLVTAGVVEAIKHTELFRKKYLPLLSIVVGVTIGGAALFVDVGLVERLWAGAISGLMAVGLYENVKRE